MVTKNKVNNEIYALPNEPSPTRPIIFDPDHCNGCNVCIEICVQDVLIPNPEKGKPPIILYPDECYYDGNCVLHCKRKGAIRFNIPLMWKTPWKDKKTGYMSWVGKHNKGNRKVRV